jgi:hypothetical protein
MMTPASARAGHAAEELDRDGGAEWDPVDRGEECDGDQSCGDAQTEQWRDIVAADLPQRWPCDEHEDQRTQREPEPGGAGRTDQVDQPDRQGGAELDGQHRADGQPPRRHPWGVGRVGGHR